MGKMIAKAKLDENFLVVAETKETLESISIEKCSLRCSQGIRRSEFYPISDTYFSRFLHVREDLTHKGRTVAPCNVDCDPCNHMKPRSASVVPQQATTKVLYSPWKLRHENN